MTVEAMTFLTTRSQYARLETVLVALSEDGRFDLDVVLSGGGLVHEFGELGPVLEEDGIDVSAEIETLVSGGTPTAQAKTTGLQLVEYATTIDAADPDVVLTTGDRYETMATTLAASYLNVPVVHFEGGEITGSIDEKVRHATTKMADYHFVSTARSERIVSALGEEDDRIFHTGCPSMDIAERIVQRDDRSYDPQTEYGGVGDDVDVAEDYVVVQYHPMPTEYQSNYEKTWELIDAMDALDVQGFWFWPNMDAGTDQVSKAIREYREQRSPEGFRFFINLETEDYLTIVRNAACMVGNSSVGIRECSYFGTPAVNIGGRQQFRERGPNVVDVPCETAAIRRGVADQFDNGRYEHSPLYGDGGAAERVVAVLADLDFEPKPSMDPARLDTDARDDERELRPSAPAEHE